ncbi:myo-inositol oxygenase [Sistotremastrum suecicum HHB10207 ss-3]|uniref:Inositol oxygenase n=1 Tax=Sistotremastrum suecicum HHB10207 ss-3 TaxID=1314776 RepID=A0A166J0V4_9AGAM|nr:myo-inositol oxygenase [Sistotremastrum suecicum HHB10207 ss-3]
MPTATGRVLDETSDAVDQVNILKARVRDHQELEPEASQTTKDKSQFRDYENACDRVKNFYEEQHEKQTMEFNIQARVDFRTQSRGKMSIWQAMEKLNTLVDDSDPDTDLSQIEHLLQTAEAIRRDGKPEWMQVVGLIHDLGKLLHFYNSGTGQWSIVGDTFPVGCAFSDKIIYPETFKVNPDFADPVYSTECGIYKPNCGLDNVMMSWGHDEYLYLVLRDQCTLPEEGLAMIRYHSFYPWHREGAYTHLMNEHDYNLLQAVREFNPYDLYSKSDGSLDAATLRPYYEGLIAKFFPPTIQW